MATAILSLVFGLTISAAIYFIFFWPAVEPPDDEDAAEAGAEDSNS
jgi:hypothetical protein